MLGTITLTVGQTDTISQKEDNAETTEVHQEEVAPHVNGEKGDDSANADEITTTEEKVVEEKQEEANEVGFKKIFRFVGFKFTLKKDKNEKAEPVQLLTVKETESVTSDAAAEENKEVPATEEVKSEVEISAETTEKEKEPMTEDATDKAEEPTDQPVVDAPALNEKGSDEVPEKSAEETGTTSEKEQEPETEVPIESSNSPPSQETQSPFKKFFTQGIFSNLRKKTSFKKPKDEEQVKEKSAEEDIKKAEETAEDAVESTEEAKVDAEIGPAEIEQIEKPTETAETEADTAEITSTDTEEQKDLKVEATREAAIVTQTEKAEAPTAETADDAQISDDVKPANDKPDVSEEVTTEAEILSSQEKAKAQGSPLKKLFTGAGLKKLSSKKQKSKKEAESKQTESGEQAAEQIQSSTESTEPQKPDSGISSPDESADHVVEEVTQAEVAQAVESEGEPATSDNEKKKDGILPWSSFKKLVTPKKRVKRPSESEDEAPGDKPKSSILSSTESAVFDEKTDELKPSEEVPSDSKEEPQTESKVEPKAEKAEPVAEEPKRKMDTSVSWEALICVGSAKKRARKTSDSDDEEPKIEEEVQPSGEEQAKTAESPLVSSCEADHENLASSPEPEEELVSTWESFKRLVTQKKKPKAEDKSDEASGLEQTASDSEIPKEESSFSLRKLIPRRKKKSDGKQVSSDVGSAEDDSDTPAVVPLSEYDNEPSAEVAVKAEGVKKEAAPVTQAKALAEDRSPSWISTTVENTVEETEGKQLSDIPEEGDTPATPKSTDNTIAEDIVELTSEAVTALEQAETEMVSAFSHVTASPVTSGETTPVPGDNVEKTDAVLLGAVETITVTASAMTNAMTEEEEINFAVTTNVLQVESAIKEEKTVLVAHEKTEATAICTGLDTREIHTVEGESLLKPSVESVIAVSQALVTELAVEDKTEKPEMASVTEDEVHEAQVRDVQTELKAVLQSPLENAVEEKAQIEEVKETPEVETVVQLQEVEAVKVAVINAIQQDPEVLEEPVVAEKSPNVEAEGPAEPTVEESICAQTVEVTEIAITKGEKVQELEDVKVAAASVEVASVEAVAMAVTEEVMATIPEVPAAETAESKEDPIPVVEPTEEFVVIKETVCVISSTLESTDSQTAELAHEAVMEKVPLVLPTGDQKIQVIVNDVEVVSAQRPVEENFEVDSTNVSVVVEEVCENVKEEAKLIKADQVREAEIIQKQSSVIVQEVIQHVVENLAEVHEEQKISENAIEQVMATIPEVPAVEIAESKEDPIPAVEPTEEFVVIKETVCVISSTLESTDSQTAELAHEAVMEKVPLVLPTGDHKIQVIVNDVEVVSAQRPVEENFEVDSTNVSVVVEDVSENVKEETELIKADQVREAEIIQKQSSVIVQEVIQHVVENLAEVHEEQKISENAIEEVSFKLEEAPAASEMIEEKPSTEVVSDEKPPSDTIPEKPNTSDTVCIDGDEHTRIFTEKPTVNEAILTAETFKVSITGTIPAQSEEVAKVSVTVLQQETEVTISEVELKQAEEKTVADKERSSESTESEDEKSQAETDPKKVKTEIEKDTTETLATQEENCPSIEASAYQDQVVAEQCQLVQEVQIETAQEFNVGVINVINADDVPETNMKDDNSEAQESVEDRPQKDSEEPQMKVLTQETKNQGESGDADCQKTDAKNVAAKLEIATEKTASTITVEEVVEDVGNEIEAVSTEVLTVS
ncbi:A-kinase anchor protein 12b isoform X2 [Myxocyprinus asiaticus]|uniref:A-kinase anchor protein 12b isoform X2 n=1 Tax=Myxocyprinus asiaticus TaxID=70543 RepID=UPI0022228AAA|nr:A-kinase anchor protein 12b isoform X2 [Myxocyprinus asiaticus]